MDKFIEVLKYLASDKTFYSHGETYEDIVWVDGDPGFTKQEFLEAFDQIDLIKEQRKSEAEAKIAALGLTAEDIRLVLE